MPEISVNLIHDMKEIRAHKAKPEFIGGLRTGYVRAWIFVVFKVWLIATLISGVNPMIKFEKDVALLDSYIHNDFTTSEYMLDDHPIVLNYKLAHKTQSAPIAIALADQPSNIVAPEQNTSPTLAYEGKVESANTTITPPDSVTTSTSGPTPAPAIPTNLQNLITSQPVQPPKSSRSETVSAAQLNSFQQYVQQSIGVAIANAIANGFVVGNGTSLVGCLQVTDGLLHGVGHNCGSGGGGSTIINSGSLAIGSAVTGATQGSVLFAGTSGVLSQDNTNFFFDDSTNSLTLGGNLTVGGLGGAGTQCLQASNTGVISGTGSACGAGGGGGGADTALSNLSGVAINTSLVLGVSDGGALGSATKMWSDLFLASGAVINFNNGDVTLTHSLDTLAVGGGDLKVTTAGNASGSVLTTDATQTVTNKNFNSGTNTFPTFNQNTTGSAATLTTPRSIYGNNFDGSANLTQVIASTFGGTGNGFTKFAGPATTEKTFTLPNASATILTSDSLVTAAQGGSGAGTLTGLLLGNGTSPFTATTTSAGIAGVLSDETGTGALVFANSPTFVTPTLGAATATSLTLSGLAGGGTQCVQVSNTGAISGTGAGCGAGAGTVTSVSGTTNRITVASGTTTPVIDISAAYVGQSSITTLGTIGTGVWQGSIVASNYGGTGNGFTKFSGPATTEKTFTLPNASATILTTDSLVTVAQGGTGAGSLTGLLLGNGTSPFTAATTSAAIAGVLSDETGTGALVFANSPTFVTPALGAATATSLNISGLSANAAVYTDGSKNLTSTVPTSGSLGYWSRSSTILQPANAGDAITTSGNISTSGTGTITSAGLLTGSAGLTVSGGTVTLTSTGASTYTVPTQTANALQVTNGTNAYYSIDTRTTNSSTSAHTFGHASTIFVAGGANSQYINATFTPGTIIANTSGDVTATGINSNIGVLFNQMTVGNNFNPGSTITESSNLLVNGAVRSSNSNSLATTTLTNSYGLNILAGSALNTASGAVTNGIGLSVNAPTGATNNYAALFNGGNVGIGNTAPASLLSVGSASQFQINSSGAITAAAGITSSGTIQFSSLASAGSQCVQASSTGVLSVTGSVCGTGGGAGYLSSLLAANTFNDINNGNNDQTWRWDSLQSTPALTLSTNSTTASGGQTVLLVASQGVNSNASQTTLAAKFQNLHSGTGSTNYGAKFIATNASTNVAAYFDTVTSGSNDYAALFDHGKVGIGTTTPSYTLEVAGTAHVSSLGIGSGGISAGTGLAVVPTLTGTTLYGIQNSSNATLTNTPTSYVGENIEMFSFGNGSQTSASGINIAYTGGATYASATGISVSSISAATTNIGISIGSATGTNHTNLAIGGSTTGAYSIYNASTEQNYFNGNLGIKASSPGADIEIGSQGLGSGAGPLLKIGRNNDGSTPAAGSINYLSMSGTNGYVWQDGAGNLEIGTSRPTNTTDTSGVVVGTQGSIRDLKQDITDYDNYGEALQMVTSAPLHTFRYKKEVSGYGTDSPLAKVRIGFIADEVSGQFMWGNSIDQVSVNGILMASVKALNDKIVTLTAQLNAQQSYPNLVMGQPNLAGTPIVLASQLYLTGDNVGQAKILAGETTVKVTFSKPYQYQPIVTTTPNGKVGSEYWVSDKNSMGFTIHIDLPATEDITFDWHSFAGESAKLTVSDGTTANITLVVADGAPTPAPMPDPTPVSESISAPTTESTPPATTTSDTSSSTDTTSSGGTVASDSTTTDTSTTDTTLQPRGPSAP